MLILSDRQPFARGGNRQMFVHPDDPNKCIKIPLPHGKTAAKFTRKKFLRNLRPPSHYDENAREEKSYRRIHAIENDHPNIYNHIPHYYGNVQTDLGSGNIFQLMRDYDGEISMDLAQRLQCARTCRTTADSLQRSIDELKAFVWTAPILIRRLLPQNICSVRLSADSERLYIVDGGSYGVAKEFLPFIYKIPYFRRKRHKRHWAIFHAAVKKHL